MNDKNMIQCSALVKTTEKINRFGRRQWVFLIATAAYLYYSERRARMMDQKINDLEDRLINNVKGA